MPRLVPTTPRADAPEMHRRIFHDLERSLGDGWLVVHEPRWVGRARPGEPLLDGGANFVLAHPEHGVLALQIVTGGLQHEPSSQRWTRQGADGTRETLADPYLTAAQAVGLLIGKLGEHPAAGPSRPAHGHGVLLPDVVAPSSGFAPHAPAELTLDRRDLGHLGASVLALAQRWQRKQPAVGNAPSRWWFRAMEDLFLRPTEARVLLRHRIADEQQAMVQLAPEQLQVLDMLARVRQAAVQGPAGTGKTLLAMHKARLLARQGQRVLLTCYNKALGHHLRDALADEPLVTAIHFHELCYDVLGLDAAHDRPPQDRAARQRFFDHDLAARLAQVATPRFDALVVDEAQDFLGDWWPSLDRLLQDPERAVRYLFFDEAQRLRDSPQVPGTEAALELRTNWRNTGRIHTHLVQLEPSLQGARCVAPPGAPVEMESCRPSRQQALRRALGRVITDGGVPAADVVVLTAEPLPELLALDVRPHRLTLDDEPGAVRLRGVRAFKGMEAPVVVLTGLRGRSRDETRRLHYVGASRATNLLIVLDDALVPA